MNYALGRTITTAEFLEWEYKQELRYEFDGAQVIAMTGGTIAHAIIQRNLTLAIGARLMGQKCQYFGSVLKIEAAGRVRYPDGFVVCSPLQIRERIIRDPVVVFEVFSPSTQETDFFVKNREYAAIPSVHRYVILSQNEVGGTMFERVGEDWIGRMLTADAILHMPEIGIDVPLSELYQGLDFPAEDEVRSEPAP